MDEVYDHTFVRGFNEISKLSFLFDSNIVDGFINRLASFMSGLSDFISKFQFGLVRAYAAVMTAGLIVIIYILFATLD
jgi:hypothetical protein